MASRNWMFTLFVNKEEDYTTFINRVDQENRETIKYVACQLERCPDTERLHVQGYIEYTKMTTLKQAKVSLGTSQVHLEKRRGNQSEAICYVTKEHTRIQGIANSPFIKGKKAQQGERTDLNNAAKKIREGTPIEQIIEENGNLIRYIKHFKEYKTMIEKPRDREEEVYVEVIIGEPGSGKTRSVYEKETDLFVMPEQQNNSMWFDGYQGQEAVIFDDFYGGIKYSTMLRLLDRYPLKVPIKGGFVQWKPKRIYITSNEPMEKWYKIRDQRALKRRINKFSIIEVAGNTIPLPIEEAEINDNV